MKLVAVKDVVIRRGNTSSLGPVNTEPAISDRELAAALDRAGFTACNLTYVVPSIGNPSVSTNSATTAPETSETENAMGDLGQKIEPALAATMQLMAKNMERMVSTTVERVVSTAVQTMSQQVATVLEETQARSVTELVVLSMKMNQLEAELKRQDEESQRKATAAKEREAEIGARMDAISAQMKTMRTEHESWRPLPLLVNCTVALALLGGTSYMALLARRQRASRTSA